MGWRKGEGESVTGVILAGGRGARIKRNKPLLGIAGKSVLQRICGVFEPIFRDKIIVIGRDTESQSIRITLDDFSGWTIFTDIIPDRGPLGGLHAALTSVSKGHTFVVACDMPFLNEGFIRHMISLIKGCDIVVPCLSGRYEPLHAVYSTSCLPVVTDLLGKRNLSILDLYPLMTVKCVDEETVRRFDSDLRMFFNINTEEDLSRAAGLDR